MSDSGWSGKAAEDLDLSFELLNLALRLRVNVGALGRHVGVAGRMMDGQKVHRKQEKLKVREVCRRGMCRTSM